MAEQKKNILFEILNALFVNKEYIESLTNETMNQNLFMVNRRLAIYYPLQAQHFNCNKVNPTDVIKYWSTFLYNPKLKKPPYWIYTSGANKSKIEKENKQQISNTIIKEFCKHYNLSQKDVNAALYFFNEDMTAELKDFESFFKLLKENPDDK